MLHIYTKVPSKISTIMVAFDAGARAEGDDFSQGIAHMLEHMMFKGTEKRHYLDIPKEIGFLGGDSNAFTSHEMVAYYITVPYENLRPSLEILSDMIFNSTFPEEEFLKERGVVLEEEAASCDNVGPFIMRKLSREFFSGRIAQPVIGTRESISGFTREELVGFYDKYYSPSNMIVSLASNLPIRAGKKLMREYFGRSTGKMRHNVDTHMPAYKHARTLNIHRPMIEHSYVYHAYPGPTVDDPDEVATDVMLEILGQGMDSRLFTEVREKNGLCYHIGASSHSLRDQGVVMIASSTRAENVEPMNELIFKEIGRIKGEKVFDEEIQKAINQHKADTYRVMESSRAYASWNLTRGFFGQSSIEEYDKKINALTPNDIIDAARRHFDDDSRLTLICSEKN